MNTNRTASSTAERTGVLRKLDLTSAIEHTSEAIVITNTAGVIQYVNPAFSTLTGYSFDEAIGKNPRLLKSNTQNPAYYHDLWTTIAAGMVWKGELINRRKDGSVYAEEMTITPIWDESGVMTGHIALKHDTTGRKLAQAKIEDSLREKESLLREIHHRVKNNLQIVCSLLKLSSRNLTDPEAKRVIEEMQHRVKAMALVHELLYRSTELAGIDFSEYIPRLVHQLLQAHGLAAGQVQLTLDVESVIFPIDIAIPCALALTELISNAAKHVFSVGRVNSLEIVFRRSGESWLMSVKNPGVTHATGAPSIPQSSFGLELVRLLTEQLDGSLRFEHTPDFRVTLLFPLQETTSTSQSRLQ